jgi:hypothetical protein
MNLGSRRVSCGSDRPRPRKRCSPAICVGRTFRLQSSIYEKDRSQPPYQHATFEDDDEDDYEFQVRYLS